MSGLFDQLRWYADETAWYFWGNTSTSSSDNDIRAMAGRTLAALVLGQFQKIWTNAGSSQNGNSQPLTLLFGDHEPIISLISLLMLDTRFPGFQSMPPQASAIVFELFSVEKDGTGFPSDPEKLWINFHFQNGTDFQGELTSYPIFGRGLSETDMPWLEFENMMSRIMTNEVLDWCTQCSSAALFCWGVDDVTEWSEAEGAGHGGGGKGGKVSPAVGGVIGAVVALVAAGLIFAAAMLLGGIRFRRVERGRRKSSLGGFKGSQKLASDADLSLPKNGAAPAGAADTTAGVVVGSNTNNKHTHERVGSWELRQKEFGPPSPTGHPAAEAESPRASFEAIEAAMARAVLPAERV